MTQSGSLAGVKVLEMGTMITAPLASMMLADLGAEVIKIEHPKGGDPFRATAGGDYGPNFLAYNHSKRSLQLDLTKPAGGAVLRKLLQWADILVENFRPGVLKKLGFGPDAVETLNPRLIHCSITGFGTSGPYCERPAYDTVGIALSGIASLIVDPHHPELVGPTIADNVTGMYACSGVLAALHARHLTGKGQRVEVNMLESAISMIPDPIAYATQCGIVYGPASRVAQSHCYAFRCADEKLITIHLSVPEKFWLNCLEALAARETIGTDPRFSTRRGRIENYPELYAALSAIMVQRTRAAWGELFARHDVPFAPVNTTAEVQDDPQVQHLGTFQTCRHETRGDVVAIRSPVRINGTRPDVTVPPLAGEQGAEILAQLGLSQNEIEQLRSESVI
jgi:crotonobetainyl-CoA:carnitine CoA-transferase CaiB-like acyl-CoA transferase